jgi:hypothetical protein
LFIRATLAAWETQTSARTSCPMTVGVGPFSYVQFDIKEQHPTEPYFSGSFFVNLGDVPSGPAQMEVDTTGGGKYGTSVKHVQLFRDDPAKTFWMTKESDEIPLVRSSGSHRDFPFDSATIDFNTTFKPAPPLQLVIIRNFNPSFYVPCEQIKAEIVSSDTIHVRFEIRRNPLVRVMAVVVLTAALLFVLIVPFAVKVDALPTSVASFFFSIWSVRGILSSEAKVFPTRLDEAILFLSVLLLLLIGIRVLWSWCLTEFYTQGRHPNHASKPHDEKRSRR